METYTQSQSSNDKSDNKDSYLYKTNLQKSYLKTNICLFGPPGSGKSSVSKRLSEQLNMINLDVDDDVLEKEWNMSVGEKLSQVGEDKFIEEEASKSKLN